MAGRSPVVQGQRVGRSKDSTQTLSENALAEQILQVVGHEIRGLLSALSLQLSLIERDPERAARGGVLPKAREQIEMMACLVRRLLTIQEMPDIESTLQLERVNFGRLIQDSCELIRESVESRGCRLVFEVEDDVHVECDPIRVRQLLFNLVENAVKFSGRGEITIRLAKKARSHAAELEIEDCGPGIPEDSLESVFGKFSRGSNAASFPGIGLGLHLCAGIARAHSWKLAVKNGRRGGAVFTVTLGQKRTPRRRA